MKEHLGFTIDWVDGKKIEYKNGRMVQRCADCTCSGVINPSTKEGVEFLDAAEGFDEAKITEIAEHLCWKKSRK